MKTVVLDTNALMMPFQFGLDLEIELGRLLGRTRNLVPEACIAELERLRGRGRKEAAAALELASRFDVVGSPGTGDEAVLALALEEEAVLVTNDVELRNRAKEAGLRVAVLRGRDHLDLV